MGKRKMLANGEDPRCPYCGSVVEVLRRKRDTPWHARCSMCHRQWPYVMSQRRGGREEVIVSDGKVTHSLGVVDLPAPVLPEVPEWARGTDRRGATGAQEDSHEG